jgi:sodium transport system permease protein
MWRPIACVARKELRDHLRDRRSVSSALLFPLLGPAIFAMTFTLIARWTRPDKVIELPVAGRENAPGLVAFLERYGAKVSDAPPDYEAKVREGSLDAVLVVEPDFKKKFASGEPAKVRLVLDSSRSSAQVGQRRARILLDRYGGSVGAGRLIARGVSPEVAMPLRVEDKDLATPEKQGATLLNMIPIFLVLSAFLGAMNVAIDVTAGERERGSLEPLLLNPVSRLCFVAGKWIATVLAAFAAVFVSLGAFYAVVHQVPLQDLGVKASFGAREVAGILLCVLPLAPLAAALQMLVATYARSFKEAQTYLQLFTIVPMVPAMLIAIHPVKTEAWMMLVPVFAQDLLIGEVMRGEPVSWAWYGIAAAAALAVTAAGLVATARLFAREKIVFGRA